MKLMYIITVATIGLAGPALAQTQPMAGPNTQGAGVHPNSPMAGRGNQGMSQGHGESDQGMGTHSSDHGAGMQNGDAVVPHHAMNGRSMDDRGMGGDDRDGMRHRHCRTVWHHHHRVRRCM